MAFGHDAQICLLFQINSMKKKFNLVLTLKNELIVSYCKNSGVKLWDNLLILFLKIMRWELLLSVEKRH